MAKLSLTTIAAGYGSVDALNANFDAIEAAIENTLSRDGTTPNTMSANLDMNSKRILNLPAPVSSSEPARLQDVQDAVAGGSASLISFSPAGNIAATSVQGAIEELDSEKLAASGVSAFMATVLDDTTAADARATLGAVGSGAVTGSGLTMTTARLLGRTTASTGAVEEISVGSGLSLAAGSLTASASWTLGTAVATTSGTTKDFTGLPANVAEIIVMLYNVSTGGTSNFLIQLGTSGGMANSGYSSQAWQGGSGDTLATSSAGFLASAGGNAARNYNGALRLTRFSGNKWVASGALTRDDGAGFACAGIKDLGAELTQLRFTTVSADTFDAGEVNILYRVA